MKKTTQLAFALFIVSALAFTSSAKQVFAQGGASLDNQIQSLQSELNSLRGRIEALEARPSSGVIPSQPNPADVPALVLGHTEEIISQIVDNVATFIFDRPIDRHTGPVAREIVRCTALGGTVTQNLNFIIRPREQWEEAGPITTHGFTVGKRNHSDFDLILANILRGVPTHSPPSTQVISCWCDSTEIDPRIRRATFQCP